MLSKTFVGIPLVSWVVIPSRVTDAVALSANQIFNADKSAFDGKNQ